MFRHDACCNPFPPGFGQVDIGANETGLTDVLAVPSQPGSNWPNPNNPIPSDPTQSAIEDVIFWVGEQFREHALFLTMGVEIPEFKKEFGALHQEFETFKQTRLPLLANPEQVIPIVIEAQQLTMKLLNRQNELLSRMQRGDWVGWIYQSFLLHIMFEENYFLESIKIENAGLTHRDKRLVRQETCFVGRMLAEHAVFIFHLLDEPNAVHRAAMRKVRDYVDELERVRANCGISDPNVLAVAVQTAENFNTFQKVAAAGIKTGIVKSLIHPLLAAHVIREANQAIRILKGQLASSQQ